MANSWNESGTTWGQIGWGTTDEFALGWGAQAWNDGEWGELNDAIITLTGVSSTSCRITYNYNRNKYRLGTRWLGC